MRKSKILLSIITAFLLILLPSCESPLDYRIGQEGIAVYYHDDPYMEIYLADYYNTKQAKLEYEGEIRNVNFFTEVLLIYNLETDLMIIMLTTRLCVEHTM